MKSKLVVFFWAVFSFSTSLAFAHIPIPPKKGDSGRLVHVPVSDFTLVDQEGKPFRLSSLRGKAVLVTFVYTTCPDVCPLFTAKFVEIQRQLKKIPVDNYFLLTITVDPEVDSPKVLKSYGQRFGADFRSWAFLTGDKDDLSKAWKAFGMTVQRRARGLVAHTELTTLIDPNGIRRINYFGHKWSTEEALKDIAALAEEGQTVSPPQSEQRVFDIKIEGRKVVGGVKTIRVKRGEQVSLRWTADETVTVHLHGYDIEKTVKPREMAVMSFRAHATGRFPVETHGFGDKKGKHIVLLYLEVVPR